MYKNLDVYIAMIIKKFVHWKFPEKISNNIEIIKMGKIYIMYGLYIYKYYKRAKTFQ